MRAALFLGPERPLEIRDVPDPVAGPGEALVRVAACGVCHTELHYLDHGVPTGKPPPLVLGHEASGTVAALGPGTDGSGFEAGDRVLVPAVVTCGRCRRCRTGRENICERMQMFGNHRDGAYAEFVTVPAKDLIRLPEGVPLEDAAIIADALSTPFHAVKNRAEVRPGDVVLVVGCGGVGLNVVQLAVLAGGRVFAADLRPAALEAARALGAEDTILVKRGEEPSSIGKELKRRTGGGADIALECVGRAETIAAAFAGLRAGGRLVLVGYATEALPIPAGKVMFFECEIKGSLGCRPADYPALVELVRAGRVKLAPLITGRFPLAEVNKALDRLRRGEGFRSLVIP
jgi:6-hydroxycyclohex-1-ene-1-carbonyl-CoA dehydrogenase